MGTVEAALVAETSSEAYSGALGEAMRYALLAPGKRVRGALVFGAGELCGVEPAKLAALATAIETLHASTLVHDDLPSMDNDSLRRGQPTTHVKFGEAVALLAGDALAARAVALIATGLSLSPTERGELAGGLAETYRIVCEGQARDLSAAQNSRLAIAIPAESAPTVESLQARHLQKTGELIAFAAAAPAFLLGAGREAEAERARGALRRYGLRLGLLFQITDDILDATGTSETLGKSAGIDATEGRVTYVSLLGLEKAREAAELERRNAHIALVPFGERAWFLRELVEFVYHRER
ncbi:MAG: polyprenyl synthetase family protein [Deltaproteobacteria bacterium]|nr:polyprenyl synthetase family protein [Deltaproteobacteria bacterium]